MASPTHLVAKLVFAAPASFLSAAMDSQDAWASRSHLVMKLVSAAPESLFAVASPLQVSAMAGARATDDSSSASAIFDTTFLRFAQGAVEWFRRKSRRASLDGALARSGGSHLGRGCLAMRETRRAESNQIRRRRRQGKVMKAVCVCVCLALAAAPLRGLELGRQHQPRRRLVAHQRDDLVGEVRTHELGRIDHRPLLGAEQAFDEAEPQAERVGGLLVGLDVAV